MKKFILTLIIALMMVFTANAQIATENQKLFDNAYVGVSIGEATPLNLSPMFPINTVVGFTVGKDITPVIGIEAEGQFFLNDNNFEPWTKTFIKGNTLGLNGTINWSNLCFGYKGIPRKFEMKTNTGFEWLRYWNVSGNDLLGKTMLDMHFNIDKKRTHTIALSTGVYWNLTGSGHKFAMNKNYAQLALFAGYIYHFKTSNGTRYFKTYDVGAMMDEINRLNQELAAKPKEVIVEQIKTVEVPVQVPVIRETVTEVSVKEPIFFAYNSSELDENAKAALDNLNTDAVYEVRGYASNEGTDEYNKNLSTKRAESVAKYLRDRGAKVSTVEGLGVIFGPSTGRVAVVTTK